MIHYTHSLYLHLPEVPDWVDDVFEEVERLSTLERPTELKTQTKGRYHDGDSDSSRSGSEDSSESEESSNSEDSSDSEESSNFDDSSPSDSEGSDTILEVDGTVELDIPGVGGVEVEVSVGSDGVEVEVEGETEEEDGDFRIGGEL